MNGMRIQRQKSSLGPRVAETWVISEGKQDSKVSVGFEYSSDKECASWQKESFI